MLKERCLFLSCGLITLCTFQNCTSPVNFEGRTIASLQSPTPIPIIEPLSCGQHAHDTTWTDTIANGHSEAGSCPGKTLIHDIEIDKKCIHGVIQESPRRLVNPHEIGFCVDCGSHTNGSTWEEIQSAAVTVPICTGKNRVSDVKKTYQCSNASVQLLNTTLTNTRDVGQCKCGARIHGATWTDTIFNGSSQPGSCDGKTLFHDVQQDKVCNDGTVNNSGAARFVNPHETGECSHGGGSGGDDNNSCTGWDTWSPGDEAGHCEGNTHFHCADDHACKAGSEPRPGGGCRLVECSSCCCKDTGQSCKDMWSM
ncbi:MAG: hypothetical protein AB7F59_08565 [Bdellovibrionales bacterium]